MGEFLGQGTLLCPIALTICSARGVCMGTRKVSHREKSQVYIGIPRAPPPPHPPTGPACEIFDPHNYGVLLSVN